ncbi:MULTISPECIES: Spy/CpxP family protein refolding chaperone [Flavobacteriaceae]|jgi:Mg/Co/Ni transporter MgtE|uniref:Sensor of ECF-type sigma factor n=1 Tax=Gaetbulibacter jejuensis TaxID=584607 RepID=A0ABN1JWS4_9FLAO|nr:sensor of ECF-type sigma factor [Meridianimaribacter sp. CL38]TBV25591.1 sensor of ECF-type sigma factor [Meridianimaribacter sp. CL38]
MKKLIVSLCFICLFATAFSQSHEEKKERINALKIAFITEHLNLTESEAQKFWPIYNAYELEEDMLRELSREKKRKINNDISEAEAKAILDDLIKLENEKHNLRTDFFDSLRKVISSKKILQLKTAEENFKRKMFEEFKKRRQERKNNP